MTIMNGSHWRVLAIVVFCFGVFGLGFYWTMGLTSELTYDLGAPSRNRMKPWEVLAFAAIYLVLVAWMAFPVILLYALFFNADFYALLSR